MKANFKLLLKKLGIYVSADINTPTKRETWKPVWTYRLISILLTVVLVGVNPGDSRADVKSKLASTLTQEEKASIVLNKLLDVPMTRTADLLSMSNDDFARRRVESGLGKLRKGLNTALGRELNQFGIPDDLADKLALREATAAIVNSLTKVPTTPGFELTKLMEDPANKIEVVGLSTNVGIVRPLLVKVPAGVLPPDTKLSLMTPVVLTPESAATQRMVVTDASLLLSNADGSSVYLLQAYCLDEQAKAPLLSNRFSFSDADQKILTPELRGILNGSARGMQKEIWKHRGKITP